ncbi:MAG: hypothetical protein SFX73_06930 [Kofleriaceae bacterium]|nr:hypothetical protein [Kofleriaceae bacterium]
MLVFAACTGTQRRAPEIPNERSLYKDLERIVTVAAATGWNVDRIEVDALVDTALDSTCRVDALDRRGLARYLEQEILRLGGPVERAWRERGKQLDEVSDLLVLTRMQLLLAAAETRSLDCPFWLEPEKHFRGRQISNGRWEATGGGGGKGIVVSQGDQLDLQFGGAGRLLFGRVFMNGDALYFGGEIGASASFPKDAEGERTSLELGIDLVTPLVYRHTLTNAYLELEAGWLGQTGEQDWSVIEHGVHIGAAFGGRALRTRFVFPGAALGVSWERTFVDGPDVTTVKVGLRVAFDLDL